MHCSEDVCEGKVLNIMPEENVVRLTSRYPLCAEVQWEELQSIDTTQIK